MVAAMAADTTQGYISRRAIARVDTRAISANCARLCRELTGGAELCAVVKADGYGHGVAQSARAALAGGATRLAVVTAAEAALLTELALGAPVIVLAPLESAELAAAVATGCELTAWSERQVVEIDAVAASAGRTVKIHVKLDTGMSRFGAKTPGEAFAALDAVAAAGALEPAAVWTHFATADESADDFLAEQLARFTAFADEARQRHPGVLAHAANSAATLRDPAAHFNFVRCGIAIYGLDPFHGDAASRELEPALSLHSYVASVRPLAAGEPVGYGRRFTAEHDTLIATVPIGYGDGWRRALTNNADVLIGGRRLPQRGTVSMDSIAVELGAGSTVEVGDAVTLIGADRGERITTEEVARRCGTINYEITCGLTRRTRRIYDAAE